MMNNKMIRIAITISAFGLLIGCSSRNAPPASVHYDRIISPYHVVKKGDSIASIARKYGMDKRELIRINGLTSPYRIVKGQRLLVRAHQNRNINQDDRDETEIPATEEIGTVPEDGDIQIKSLGPASGVTEIPARRKGGIESQGRFNEEVDDEAQGEIETDSRPRRYDEDALDEAQLVPKRPNVDQPSSISAAPPADNNFTWPAQGTVTRSFSPSGKGKAQNDGINIAAAKGSPVVAANNGVVAHAGNQLRGFGNVVLVKHDNGMMTVYAHLDKVSVKKGDIVNTGQKLGTVGQTGTVKEPQLHFEIRKGRKPIDPNQYLR